MGLNVRGNAPMLFLLFFGATTLLAGATYESFQLYSASRAAMYALAVAAGAAAFLFALLVTARILYKAAGGTRG